jgi:hypothetical protein
LRPKLKTLQSRALRAGKKPWSDHRSPTYPYRIERGDELAESWSNLQKQKDEGSIEREDFAGRLKALVKAQTTVLAMFTIRRDTTSTILGKLLIEMPKQKAQLWKCSLSDRQHEWVEIADSRERRRARATAKKRIELWKSREKKLAERPTFENQMNSCSFNVSSRSFLS